MHVPVCTYIEEKLPAAVSTNVPTAVRTYLLHLPGTRVPTDGGTYLLPTLLFLLMYVRTSVVPLSNAISTHIQHETAAPNVCNYCCTYN